MGIPKKGRHRNLKTAKTCQFTEAKTKQKFQKSAIYLKNESTLSQGKLLKTYGSLMSNQDKNSSYICRSC